MHTDRNHSFLPPRMEPPWWHVETFLYLSDVDDGTAPTHLVSRRDSAGSSVNDIFMPDGAPGLYARERPARGVRGSLLAYRPDVFHRAVPMTRTGRRAVPVERELQGRGPGLDRLPLDAVAGDASGLGAVRRRLDPAGARALRVSAAGTPGVERRASRRDGFAVPRSRSRALARRGSPRPRSSAGGGAITSATAPRITPIAPTMIAMMPMVFALSTSSLVATSLGSVTLPAAEPLTVVVVAPASWPSPLPSVSVTTGAGCSGSAPPGVVGLDPLHGGAVAVGLDGRERRARRRRPAARPRRGTAGTRRA